MFVGAETVTGPVGVVVGVAVVVAVFVGDIGVLVDVGDIGVLVGVGLGGTVVLVGVGVTWLNPKSRPVNAPQPNIFTVMIVGVVADQPPGTWACTR